MAGTAVHGDTLIGERAAHHRMIALKEIAAHQTVQSGTPPSKSGIAAQRAIKPHKLTLSNLDFVDRILLRIYD